MRSAQADLRRMTTLTTLTPIPDAAAGDGVWSDGTPWHSVRSATGQYDIYFDPRLVAIGGSVGPIQVARATYIFETPQFPGTVRIQCLDSAGAGYNRTFDVTMTCLDTRT